MLFSDERKHSLSVPAKDDKASAVTVGWLVDYLCRQVMKDPRVELFVLDGHVYAPDSVPFHSHHPFSTMDFYLTYILSYTYPIHHQISFLGGSLHWKLATGDWKLPSFLQSLTISNMCWLRQLTDKLASAY